MGMITTESTFLMLGTPVYTASSDTTVQAGKKYYTRSGSSPSYVYTLVANPTGNPSTSNYYEVSSYTYAKLCDITEFPDLGTSPANVDSTTLSDHQKTSKKGLVDYGTLEFSAYYDKSDFIAIEALTGERRISVWFGEAANGTPDGHEGKWTCDGEITATIKGGGVEAMVGMGLSINVNGNISFV